MEQKTSMLDEFGQAYHDSLPNPYDFSNIRDTRSIYDDMNCPKYFYLVCGSVIRGTNGKSTLRVPRWVA